MNVCIYIIYVIHDEYVTYKYIHTRIYNLLSPFNIAHVYMCPEMTTWDRTSYLGTYPWKKLILPLFILMWDISFIVSCRRSQPTVGGAIPQQVGRDCPER